MASVICPITDQSAFVVRKNMAKIKLLTVAGPLLPSAPQANRVVRLLENRRSWGIEPPLVMGSVLILRCWVENQYSGPSQQLTFRTLPGHASCSQ